MRDASATGRVDWPASVPPDSSRYCSYAICRTPLLPLFARDLGAGPALIGVVVGASTVTGILVKLPAGALSDVLGRRPLLLAGALVFALMPFTYLGVTSLAALIVLRGRARQRDRHLRPGGVGDRVRPRPSGAARRVAQHLRHRPGRRAGARAPSWPATCIAAGRFDLAFVAAGVIGLAAPLIVGSVVAAPATRTAPTARWPAFRPASARSHAIA